MKVLLIEPPPLGRYGNLRSKGMFGSGKIDMAWPPIDLLVLAGYLRVNGFECDVIDGNVLRPTQKELKSLISNYNPDIVIVNTSTPTIYSDLVVTQLTKKVSKDILTGAIGVHVMALPRETLAEEANLDFVTISECEEPILEIVKGEQLKKVKGIAFRDKNKKIKMTQPRPPLKNLDVLDIPAHDLVPLNLYKDPFVKKLPMTMTLLTRGCVNRCTFCSSVFYNYFRTRSVQNIIKELSWITNELGVREVRFMDDGITYNKKWGTNLFKAMKNACIEISWSTNLRADFIDRELLKTMKDAGCHTVHFGVESGNQTILNNVKKNLSIQTIKKATKLIKQSGIQMMNYFILGLPGETKETMKQTLEFAKELDGDIVTFNIATPHPGTEFYYYLKKMAIC